MKYALFLFGEYRTFETIQKSLQFANELDFDIFVSTWSVSETKCPVTGIVKNKNNIKDSDIRKYFPNAHISVTDFDSVPNEHPLKQDMDNVPNKMIFHYKKCLEMYREQNKPVDFIILSRMDMMLDFDFSQSFSTNHLYCCDDMESIYNEKSVNDVFFFGSETIMTKFIDSIESYTDTGPHIRIAKSIIKNKFKVFNIRGLIETYLIRPMTENTANDYLDGKISMSEFLDIYYKDFEKWVRSHEK